MSLWKDVFTDRSDFGAGRRSKKDSRCLLRPHVVEEVVRQEFAEVVEFETVLTQEGAAPVLTLRLELDPSIAGSQAKDVLSRLRERLKIRTSLTFELEMAKPGELPRYTLKSARFKDLTKK